MKQFSSLSLLIILLIITCKMLILNKCENNVEVPEDKTKLCPSTQVDGVSASDGIDNLYIEIKWNNVLNASKYNVYRSLSAESNFLLIASTSTNIYKDYAVPDGNKYYYKISADKTNCTETALSETDYGYIIACPVMLPQNLTASDGTETDKIILTWEDSVNASFYKIYKSLTPGQFNYYATSKDNSYEDTNVESGNLYYYAITASKDDCRETNLSNSDKGSVFYCPFFAPENLKATDNKYTDKIVITWDQMNSVDSYNIYRSISPQDDFEFIGDSTTNRYEDKTALKGKQYYYNVSAIKKSCAETDKSNHDRGQLLQCPLDKPTGLDATDAVGGNRVVVSWDYLANCDGYYIYRSDHVDGPYDFYAESGKLYFDDLKVEIDKNYYYKVSAYRDGCGETELTGPDMGYIIQSAQYAVVANSASSASCYTSVDASENDVVVAAGWINRDGDFYFGDNLVSGDYAFDYNAVIVKYDDRGSVKWAKSVDNALNKSQFNDVAIAPDGSIYAVGEIHGNQDFKFGNIIVKGNHVSDENLIIVKYSSDGDVLWAKSVDNLTTGQSKYNSVAVSSDGSIYAAGYIYGNSEYIFSTSPSVTVTGQTMMGYNALYTKYDSSGQILWAYVPSTSNTTFASSEIEDISINQDGSIVAVGKFSSSSTYTFGSLSAIYGVSAESAFIFKYDENGNALWSKSVTGSNNASSFYSVASVSNGNIYAVGSSLPDIDFGSGQISPPYYGDNVVIVKYDNLGNTLWTKSTITASRVSGFYGVATTPDDSAYSVGYMKNNLDFDFGSGIINGIWSASYNCVFVKYTENGDTKWTKSATDGGVTTEFNDIASTSDGKLYVVGYLSNTYNYEFDYAVQVSPNGSGNNAVLIQYK